MINMCLRYASQLSIGDEVLVHRNYKLVPQKVINISNVAMPGDDHYYIFWDFLYIFFVYYKVKRLVQIA